MRRAAGFWCQARQQGVPTADAKALDGDMILAAQAVVLAEQGHEVVIATANVRRLSGFTPAELWRDIVR
jgi:hypothetical protein